MTPDTARTPELDDAALDELRDLGLTFVSDVLANHMRPVTGRPPNHRPARLAGLLPDVIAALKAARAERDELRTFLDVEVMPRYVEMLDAAGIPPSQSVVVGRAKELLPAARPAPPTTGGC